MEAVLTDRSNKALKGINTKLITVQIICLTKFYGRCFRSDAMVEISNGSVNTLKIMSFITHRSYTLFSIFLYRTYFAQTTHSQFINLHIKRSFGNDIWGNATKIRFLYLCTYNTHTKRNI